MAEVRVTSVAKDGPSFVTEIVKVTLAPRATREADAAWRIRKSAVAAKLGMDRRKKSAAANPAGKGATGQTQGFAPFRATVPPRSAPSCTLLVLGSRSVHPVVP